MPRLPDWETNRLRLRGQPRLTRTATATTLDRPPVAAAGGKQAAGHWWPRRRHHRRYRRRRRRRRHHRRHCDGCGEHTASGVADTAATSWHRRRRHDASVTIHATAPIKPRVWCRGVLPLHAFHQESAHRGTPTNGVCHGRPTAYTPMVGRRCLCPARKQLGATAPATPSSLSAPRAPRRDAREARGGGPRAAWQPRACGGGGGGVELRGGGGRRPRGDP